MGSNIFFKLFFFLEKCQNAAPHTPFVTIPHSGKVGKVIFEDKKTEDDGRLKLVGLRRAPLFVCETSKWGRKQPKDDGKVH